MFSDLPDVTAAILMPKYLPLFEREINRFGRCTRSASQIALRDRFSGRTAGVEKCVLTSGDPSWRNG